MKAQEKNNIVESCQADKAQSVTLLYKAAAEALPALPRNPRKTPKLRAQAIFLEAECQKVAETCTMKNALAAWQNILKYAATRTPWQDGNRERTESESLEAWVKLMKRFLEAAEAPEMTYINLSVTWTSSRTWGWCPRVHARTNEHSGDEYASGYGYDKLSHAASTALQSATMTRFAIEHMDELQGVYGFSTRYGLPEIDFAGCGLNTLESILEHANWPKYQSHRRVYDRKGSTIGAYYSNN